MSGHSEYYDWLMDIIKGPGGYSQVLNELWNTEFYSIVPNDDNRAADGVCLRYYYEDDTGEYCDKTGACTVLEMMIGLALRMENDFLYDGDYGDRTHIWFWDMVKSLGLSRYPDRSFYQYDVRCIIEDFLDRKGGIFLFPVVDRNFDWTEMEIWWQLNKYILDRFS